MRKLICTVLCLSLVFVLLTGGFALPEERNMQVVIDYDGSNNPIYIGKAATGTASANTQWQIKRITYSGTNPTNIQWADGNSEFDNSWTNRASLTYR